MTSVLANPSPRGWWFSSSSKTTKTPLSEKPTKSSNATKFNSLASAFGFKSRKHRSDLAIQDRPPLPAFPPPQSVKRPARTPNTHHANRPPSNSVSSTLRSSIELRTPSHTPKDPVLFQTSLLSLSDPDPFASQGISAPLSSSKPSIKSPLAEVPAFESRRFSAHFTVDSIPPVSPQTPPASSRQPEHSNGSKASLKRLHESTHDTLGGSEFRPQWPIIPKSGAPVANTIPSSTAKTREIPIPKGNRKTPSREPSLSQKSVTFDLTTTTPASPRSSILRQVSASRLSKPPKAPPVQTLPPPPVADAPVDDLGSFLPSDSSPSSSIMSFTSSLCPNFDEPSLHRVRSNRQARTDTYAAIRNLPHGPKPVSIPNSVSSPVKLGQRSPSRDLKKAASHQSFSSKPESIRSGYGPEDTLDKRPRRQRSYRARQSRPVPHSASPNFASFVPPGDGSEVGSTNKTIPGSPIASRRRFFSGTGVRPPSRQTERDTDVRSVMSLPLENERAQNVFFPASKPMSVTTSSLHESIRDEPPPPPASPEYIPQHILSPAELLRVEASIEAGIDDYPRGRRSRVPSSHSTNHPSDMFNDFSFPGSLSPPASLRASVEKLLPPSDGDTGSQTPRRNSSLRSKEPSLLRPRTRPPTLQAQSTAPTSPITSSLYSPSVYAESVQVSLPPPPRPRGQRALTVTYDTSPRLSVNSYVPLSPPPVRRNTRSNPSLESTILRRSIMRKPSFLEIDDDVERDCERQLGDSFLDLHRESFDTVRSLEPGSLFSQSFVL